MMTSKELNVLTVSSFHEQFVLPNSIDHHQTIDNGWFNVTQIKNKIEEYCCRSHSVVFFFPTHKHYIRLTYQKYNLHTRSWERILNLTPHTIAIYQSTVVVQLEKKTQKNTKMNKTYSLTKHDKE